MEEMLLSLVVPIYNGSAYIDHLFHQFDDQNMETVELVCVDDGSKDDTYLQLQHIFMHISIEQISHISRPPLE